MSKKDIEEVKEEEIKEEPTKSKKEYSGDLRGFKTLEDAINYPNTAEFKKLDIGCRTEYQEWLDSILKED